VKFIPNTDADRAVMLESLGLGSVDELFAAIPEEVRFRGELDLPSAASEYQVARHMRELAGRNATAEEYISFLGGGAYDHFLPAAVDHILSRGEFYTAYTPYQPEVSQGTLQAIFEYQSMICLLTGMEVANASMYDGGSAVAEAAMMAGDITRLTRVVVSSAVNPAYRGVLRTYLDSLDWEVTEVPCRAGVTDGESLTSAVGDDVSCVIVQHPNFFGSLEPMEELARAARKGKKTLLVVVVDPLSLGVLKPPSAYGADIVVGEGQPLGNSLSFGGPYLGFFASRMQHVRKMPGRIIGRTQDVDGRRGFVMTLQTREQHIRRERATSNICSNEALNALAATVYMSLLGKQGVREVGLLSLQKAHYAAEKIAGLQRFHQAFDAPFFKEFVVRCDIPAQEVLDAMLEHRILAGLDLGRHYRELRDHILITVTEKRTKEEIDYFTARLEGLV